MKILDFGIASLASRAGRARDADGHAMGTPAFMAPEQARRALGDVDAGPTVIGRSARSLFTRCSAGSRPPRRRFGEELTAAALEAGAVARAA